MIRVLVVDDSVFMRNLISDILSSDSEIKVVGTASNGEIAIKKNLELKPDVITLDLEMPYMNGLTCIKEIMKKDPVPILVLSAYSKEGSTQTIKAIEAGAIDFVEKPSGELSFDIELIKDLIIQKVKVAAIAKVKKFELKLPLIHHFSSNSKKIVIMGSSTGGPQTIEALLSLIPKNFPAPILIVQHMPKNFTKSFAKRLNSITKIEVKEAADNEIVEDGIAYIAPGNYHMTIDKKPHEKLMIKLNQDSLRCGVRPSVDTLFESAAKIYKENTIGVILTGMGFDGKNGCKKIKEHNGTVIAQNEESSIIYGMPKKVIESGYADLVLNVNQIGKTLIDLIKV